MSKSVHIRTMDNGRFALFCEGVTGDRNGRLFYALLCYDFFCTRMVLY